MVAWFSSTSIPFRPTTNGLLIRCLRRPAGKLGELPWTNRIVFLSHQRPAHILHSVQTEHLCGLCVTRRPVLRRPQLFYSVAASPSR